MNTKPSIVLRSMTLLGVFLCALGFLALFLTSLSTVNAATERSTRSAEALNGVIDERWRIFADMVKTRGDPGVVALNNKIYVIGGYFPTFFGYNQTQEVYDPQTDTWQYAANIPIGESDMAVETYAGNIYAIGGWNVNMGGSLSYTLMYDPLANNWITKTAMITPVSGAGSVVMTDTIVILGGFFNSNNLADVQIYDPALDSWSLGTPMPAGRSEFSAVFLNGKVYAIGGVVSGGVTTNTVSIYDPVANSWTAGPPLPEARASMAVDVRQGKIYVVGGTNDRGSGTSVNTTFVFDPGLGSWSSVTPMPTARYATRAAVISDTIYVIGGVGDPGASRANEGYGFPPVTSTVTINSDDPDPSQFNQPFTVSYSVTATGVIPTGVVTVTVGNRPESCTGSLVNGVGNCQLAINALGTFTLTATYGGDYILLPSSDKDVHTIIKADTNTIISSEPEPSLFGMPITTTFTVSSPFGLPTGAVTITVSNNSAICSGILTNGTGNCSLTFDAPGVYTLNADYPGDTFFNPSTDTKTHVVVPYQLFLPIIPKE